MQHDHGSVNIANHHIAGAMGGPQGDFLHGEAL
jgi:hypothetical protein